MEYFHNCLPCLQTKHAQNNSSAQPLEMNNMWQGNTHSSLWPSFQMSTGHMMVCHWGEMIA
ncbi:hypothetical protein ZEAMMB73_Zm00001d038014 [Zea mays]|uniref:Uncharacterized protein n=1 Tax=Zea mays TaxID=4577 RepID=A0A1D6M2R4_MAIZE|nr:hypothetical protein ZEAMMB73_Zm00001d038014 [Zea mays]